MYKSLNFFSLFLFFLFNINSYSCWKLYHCSVHWQSTWHEFLVAPYYFLFYIAFPPLTLSGSKRLWLPPSYAVQLCVTAGIICVFISTASSAFEFRAHYWLFKMRVHPQQMLTLPCLVSLIWFVSPGAAFCPMSPFPFKTTKVCVLKRGST